MTSELFRRRLSTRATDARVSLSAEAIEQLEAYLRLLTVWNGKINLTALPLKAPTDETFDRLLIEPLAAARFSGALCRGWFDLGSGGGSPAVPFKIIRPQAKLTMVESRARKAAFLREVVRTIGLVDTEVVTGRFEDVAAEKSLQQTADLVTARAVKADAALCFAMHRLLAEQGRGFLFHSTGAALRFSQFFRTVKVVQLGASKDSELSILRPMFRRNIVD